MKSRVKTGDVFQIRKNGPNYIALGRARDNEGVYHIVATKNGNITKGGEYRRGTGRNAPKIQIIQGEKVNRVHGNRIVDIDSVKANNTTCNSHLHKTTFSNGVTTDAPNIIVQIRELAAGL